jgi:hypothetical protein
LTLLQSDFDFCTFIDIPANVLDELEFHFVRTAEEVLQIAFEGGIHSQLTLPGVNAGAGGFQMAKL